MKTWHKVVLAWVGSALLVPPFLALVFWWMIVCMSWAIK